MSRYRHTVQCKAVTIAVRASPAGRLGRISLAGAHGRHTGAFRPHGAGAGATAS